ncbi:hypothetical protein AVEN_112693-1 [Araneus ventricosus]|uniref:Secreted protein n=1 Tax=Araneus ventricosus TaxID=182803 RepID=A0A4Y2K080_ARAVE|nr:hypothetical protein AVEN_112693-1 [Araneus ventricosus]
MSLLRCRVFFASVFACAFRNEGYQASATEAETAVRGGQVNPGQSVRPGYQGRVGVVLHGYRTLQESSSNLYQERGHVIPLKQACGTYHPQPVVRVPLGVRERQVGLRELKVGNDGPKET